MSERLTLELELLDKVGGPAKRVADSLRRLDEQNKKLQAQLQKQQDRTALTAERAAQRTAVAAERAREREIAATRRLALVQMQAHKMNEAFDKKRNGGFFASFREKLPFRSVGDYAKGAFWGHVAAEGVTKIGEGFVEGARKAVEFLAEGVKKAFEAGSRSESQRLGYRLSLGKEGAASFEAETQRMAGLTPFNENQIGSIMTMLNQAGLRGKSGRTAFATAGDIAAGQGRGADEHAVEEIANQLARIKLGGTIDKQHLLALGLDFKTFYASLGKQLHMSAEQVQKKASEGKLDPQILLNEVTAQQNKKQGGIAGTGMAQAAETMQARLNRLGDLPELYLAKMSKSTAWDRLSNKLGNVLDALDPNKPQGQKIIGALFEVFEKLSGWIQKALTPENIKAFSDGVASLVMGLQKIPAILDTVLTISEALAAVWVGKKIVDAISAGAAGLATLSAPVLAVGAAVAAVGIAIARIKSTIDELGGVARVKDDFDYFLNGKAAVSKGNAGFAAMQAENARNVEAAKVRAAGKGMSMGDVNVSIVAAPGDDPARTHRRAGDEVMSQVANGFERMASEGG